ncbi:MAG TPA: HEAT repeat domain-containing protein [Candidatus Acidoferrales bacterium]|nr:HEAT repeat domain-containing protein [Candidatus Acidoferrales bacterium]
MGSIFDRLLRFGPSVLVVKAIIAAIVADFALVAAILIRRGYRRRFFRRRDERVFWMRQNWDDLISGKLPLETWRQKPFDRRIVEEIVLDAFEAAGPQDSAKLLRFLRQSGLIEKRIFEARNLRGWRRRKALVALGRTRAPEGVPALAEGLRDKTMENRHAALRGLGRMGSPEAGTEILDWIAELGLVVAPLPVQNALINCCRERPQILVPYLQRADGEVREVLARVMAEVATPSLEEDLIGLSEDELPELRAAAARAMSSAQPFHAVEVLAELSKDTVWFVRLRAVVAMGKLRNELATPHILYALSDSNRLVRMRAGEALIGQPGKMAPNFAEAVAMHDRYGLHAYLAALENAGVRPKLEEELRNDKSLKKSDREMLLEVLQSGKLPYSKPAIVAEEKAEPVVG